MNIREFTKPLSAAKLNESLAKTYGQKLKLDTFTLEQLEDARNKLRTQVFTMEQSSNFGDLDHNETYQKTKAFIDTIHAEISEREDISEGGKPDFLDLDKDGNKKEPMKKAAKDAKKNKKVDEGDGIYHDCAKSFKHKTYGECTVIPGEHTLLEDGTVTHYDATFVREGKTYVVRNVSVKDMYDVISEGHTHAAKKKRKKKTNEAAGLREGKEDEAELVMASKDMVDRVTGWMEDTAEMQAESMLELGDAIRDEMGSEQSEQYIALVKPALEELYQTMETTRTALTNGVAMLTGEGGLPAEDMGVSPEEAEEPASEEGDEFGAAAPAAGGEEPAGREQRESKELKGKKLAEASRKLGTILSKKK